MNIRVSTAPSKPSKAAAPGEKRRDPSDTKSERLAQTITRFTGSTAAFGLALLIIVTWAISGPIFHYSDTWQLIMNTASSITTFLMVFLIQRAQNKDALAIHVKLNEIIKAIEGASNQVVDAEDLSEATLLRLQERYQRIAENAAKRGDPPPAKEKTAELAIPTRTA